MISPHRLRNAATIAIRDYFREQNFLEVITPLFVKSPAIEPYLDAFRASGVDREFWLPTSPEFGLKKTLALEPPETVGVFEIAHAFRDDRPSKLHAAEFTMVEWYRRNTDYLALADHVNGVLQAILTPYSKPLPETKLYTVQEYCAAYSIAIPASLLPCFTKGDYLYGVEQSGGDGITRLEALSREFEIFFDEAIQPTLRHNECLVFLYGFPAFSRGMAELDPVTGLACRIECFYKGIELSNGYREISEPDTVEQLFIHCNKIRLGRGLSPYPADETLLHLTPAMQGVAGMAMGLERALMAFFDIDDINRFSLS